MATSSDLGNMNIPVITKEIREELLSAFDALSNWRDEIEGVNERSLAKVLIQTSAVARSMEWPDQAIRATRENLENASKMQTEMIDQIMDGWQQQLKSPTGAMTIPSNFVGQMSRPADSAAMTAFSPLAPWAFWLQAAEMWQRTWMPETPTRKPPRSH
jgi:hypothetical protein